MIKFPIMFEIRSHEELDIIECAIMEFKDSDPETEKLAREMQESIGHIQKIAEGD